MMNVIMCVIGLRLAIANDDALAFILIMLYADE